MTRNRTRFISLDLLRCVGIVLLLLAHIGQTINSPIGGFFGWPGFYYVSLGGLAVTIFLILSGFVLQLQYGERKINYFSFIAKRILRIYPVYWLSLLFGIVLYSVHSYYYTDNIFSNFSKLEAVDIVLSITGAYAFAGEWGGPFLKTSWFIALIMAMYIFFPVLSYGIKRRPFFSIILILLISALSRLILGKYGFLQERPLDWFPLCRIFEFSLGIYLAVILPKKAYTFLDAPSHLGTVINFMGELSFPLFLVHYPNLFIIEYLPRLGLNQSMAICCYVFVSLLVSWIILETDKKIPQIHRA